MVEKEVDEFTPQLKSFDIDKEIKTISNFLKDVKTDTERLRILLEEMKILRNHSLQRQIEKWHEILKFYECLDTDVAINAIRLQKISNDLKKKAEKEKIDPRWIETLKKDERWNFDWA